MVHQLALMYHRGSVMLGLGELRFRIHRILRSVLLGRLSPLLPLSRTSDSKYQKSTWIHHPRARTVSTIPAYAICDRRKLCPVHLVTRYGHVQPILPEPVEER